MTSRYGRNKRRRAREQIEAQSRHIDALSRHVGDQAEAMRMDRALLRRQSEQLAAMRERMQDWDQRIRAMLGPYTSAAVGDTTFRVDRLDDVRQMPIMPRIDPTAFLRCDVAAQDQASYYVEAILHLIGSLREGDRMRLARDLAFDIVGPGDYPKAQARFGMSESYFNDLRRAGPDGVAILARRIAPQIAELLLTNPKKKARGAA